MQCVSSWFSPQRLVISLHLSKSTEEDCEETCKGAIASHRPSTDSAQGTVDAAPVHVAAPAPSRREADMYYSRPTSTTFSRPTSTTFSRPASTTDLGAFPRTSLHQAFGTSPRRSVAENLRRADHAARHTSATLAVIAHSNASILPHVVSPSATPLPSFLASAAADSAPTGTSGLVSLLASLPVATPLYEPTLVRSQSQMCTVASSSAPIDVPREAQRWMDPDVHDTFGGHFLPGQASTPPHRTSIGSLHRHPSRTGSEAQLPTLLSVSGARNCHVAYCSSL